jgi:pimeloyl-ACP methyl ester carboxylesterase
VQDIAELIPALGYSSCILAAHDWGAAVSWYVTAKYPELVDRLIVMNCPHSKVFTNYVRRNCGQLFKSWYIFMFQVPKLPELVATLRDYLVIENSFKGSFGALKNQATITQDEVEAYKYTFSQPGALTGPINYYRCIAYVQAMRPYMRRKINVPTLIIWGDSDAFLSCEMADQHGSVCTDVTVKHIPDCSHWVQQDAPNLCNQFISDFLLDKAQQ